MKTSKVKRTSLLKILSLMLILAMILAAFSSCIEGEKGEDGKDGEKGEQGIQGEKGDTGDKGDKGGDGITPKLKVNEATGLWEVSYDNGTTWESLGVPATGAQGAQGIGIQSTYVDENLHLWVVLTDGTKMDAGYVGSETFTVKFVDTDGTVIKSVSGIEKGEKVIPPKDPQKEDYRFLGWTREGEKFPQINISNVSVTSDITFVANWYYAPEDHHKRIYDIVKFTPLVDGIRDPEYAYSTEVTLRDYGEEYATGSIYFLWDDERLYFSIEIYDKTPSVDTPISSSADCIDMLFSFYNYDINATDIPAKQMSDIGDAQFRVMSNDEISACTTLVDNGLDYEKHGGYGKYIHDNTNWDDPSKGSNYIVHSYDENGYYFEGFVEWGDELQSSDYPIGEKSIIGIGIQVNDDINNDGVRDKRIYSFNSGSDDMSMTGNRATCGRFELVDPFIYNSHSD